ncbi:hypothetical protein C8R48DRAFT_738104 [Suillus tomentosus]|nr:hypothetical protein C8R48DRAFT_738104 [Suillus tomentosus]
MSVLTNGIMFWVSLYDRLEQSSALLFRVISWIFLCRASEIPPLTSKRSRLFDHLFDILSRSSLKVGPERHLHFRFLELSPI